MSDNSNKKVPILKRIKRPLKSKALPTKIVIRHLPPTLTSEQFIKQVEPISDHNYYYYVKGDPLLGEFSYSRAYINFINRDDILHFKEKFDNYVFVDERGQEYTAIVELALYQGVPKRRKKIDAKCKTIESDLDFIQFIQDKENLDKADVNLPSVQECLEEIEAKEKKGDGTLLTPLLEYINNVNNKSIMEVKKRSRDRSRERRRKEERERKRREKDQFGCKSTSNKSSFRNRNNKESWQSTGEQSTTNTIKSTSNKEKEVNCTKEPRRRFRNRRDDTRSNENKNDKNRERRNDSSNNCTSTKKEEPTTFTVKILKNETKTDKQSDSSGSCNLKSNESKDKRPEKVRNKDRPSMQIYRPQSTSSAKSSTSFQNKDQKETKKTSQG